MEAFEYASPTTLREALALLGQDWQGRANPGRLHRSAGLMKDYIESPKRVVNIKAVKELDGIRKASGGLRIGALVTLDELSKNAEVRTEYPSLAEAARGVASMQTRNMGTVGGDLCQRPRCWYFRLGYGLLAKGKDGQSLVPHGDNRYHAIFGNRAGVLCERFQLGPPLAALGAKVKLASASGSRELPIEKFFVTPQSDSERETALRPDEILTEIVVPTARGAHNATYEIRQKTALDWPLATASVVLRMRGASVAEARVVLGHVAPTPWSAEAAGKVLAGKALTPAVAEEAGKAAGEGATPLSGNGYKVQLVRTAVKRALLEAGRGKA